MALQTPYHDFHELIKLSSLKVKGWSHTRYTEGIPLMQTRVMCGLFGISDDYVEKFLSLDERFIKNKEATFIFRMEGQSMEPVIFENEYILVDRAISAFYNRVVIADYCGERMCKYLSRKNGRPCLHSFNPQFKDIVLTDEADLYIFGVATVSFKELQFLPNETCIKLLR